MMKLPLVSIIVPIYKVEDYLERCIKSLVVQTYKNIEIILVDDGSPDSCPVICDFWSKEDKRIKVIHKMNGGLSDARNVGLSVATGEYIVFVDSDDWVSIDFVECLYKGICNSASDICECEVIKTNKYGFCDEINYINDPVCYNTEEALKELIQDSVFHQYVWNKIYTRECVAGIQFVKGKLNEDEFWTYQVFGKAKQVSKIKNKLYYYFQRCESIMGSYYNIRRLDALEGKLERQQYIDLKFPSLSGVAGADLIKSCMYSGQMILLYMNNVDYKEAIGITKSIFRKVLKRKYKFPISIKQKIWVHLANINFVFICKLRNWLNIGN